MEAAEVRSRLLPGGSRHGGATGNEPGLMRFLEEAGVDAAWRHQHSSGSGSSGGSGNTRSNSSARSSSPNSQGSAFPSPAVSQLASKPPPRFSGISQLWQAVGLQVGSHAQSLHPRSLEQLLQAEGVPARCVHHRKRVDHVHCAAAGDDVCVLL